MQHLPAPHLAAAFADWLATVADEPWRHDFYQVLRRFEAFHPQMPRLGEAARPLDEPLRVGQPAELSFAPASLHALEETPQGVPRVMQRIFGLLGPNGALPIHWTELTRERTQHHRDRALQRFLDLLTHRFALLFYRAWAQAQPVTSLDRMGDDAFLRRLMSLCGLGDEAMLRRDALGDHSKLHYAGRLGRHTRDAEGLQSWCRMQFDADVRVEPWCGHWMDLSERERTRMLPRHHQGHGQQLGRGAVLGRTVWDVQHKFRLVIGPLRWHAYLRFLPGGPDLARLQALVRSWTGLEFEWDVRLILHRDDVPRARTQSARDPAGGQLGRSTWLGRRRRPGHADDVLIDAERTLRPAMASPP